MPMDSSFTTLAVTRADSVGIVFLELAIPSRYNALTPTFFTELPECIEALDSDPNVRVIVVAGKGKHFCSGIDLASLQALLASTPGARDGAVGAVSACTGRQREALRRSILRMQKAISALEACRKPVIAAVHGACIGGAIDIITACDLRYCTDSTSFSVKEVDLAIVADLGTLQRLPKIIGDGNARELALTARFFDGKEAFRLGLVQASYSTDSELRKAVLAVASTIARKSPLAVIGTKQVLNHSRDHSVKDSLEYTATWNSAMLLSDDMTKALAAASSKVPAEFSKL